MIGFFIKKNLCDVWDNIFYVVITNFLSLVVIFCSILIFKYELFLEINEVWIKPLFLLTWIFVLIFACSIAFAGAENAAKIAKFNSPRYADFFKKIFVSFKDGILIGVFIGVVTSIGFVSIPFYLSMWKKPNGANGSFIWFLFVILIFWFLVITFFALQWYMPIRVNMRNGFFKSIKKSYLLFLDNMGFSFVLAFVNFLNMLLTLVTFGLYPGMTGVIITNMNAFRMRMYKYDWLEVNPELSIEERKNVPWDDLLAKDKKTLGPRPLKSFIFPWKE